MTSPGKPHETIVVTAVESNTPLGLNMAQSAAAIRAGMSGFVEFPFYKPIIREFDPGEDPIQVASHGLIGGFDTSRLFELIFGPITNLVQKSGLARTEMPKGGIYFALPAEDEVISEYKLRQTFLKQAARRLALPEVGEFLAVQTGSTGVYVLVDRAMEKLRSGELNFCIIAAVDSYLLKNRLAFYDKNWRLKTDRNPTGFIPGEAGAVILLETEEHAKKRQAPILMKIDGVFGGMEPNPITGLKTSTGAGFTTAIASLAELKSDTGCWRWILSDLNGERYKAYEWGVVLPRLNKLIAADHLLSHMADSIGDVGSALAAVQIGCVAQAYERNYAPADAALLLAGNDRGNRYAMTVSRVPQNNA